MAQSVHTVLATVGIKFQFGRVADIFFECEKCAGEMSELQANSSLLTVAVQY